MALEVIQQVLAPDNAPYINRVSAGRKLSEALLENAYQGLVETNNRGVTDKFTTEAEVNENAQIFVNRILPVEMQPREQGASVNGGSFSNVHHYTQTTTVSIPLLITIDDTIVVPGSRQRMIKTDLLAEQTNIYGQRLNTIINGATAASKLHAVFKADAEGEEVNIVDITEDDITNKLVADRILDANDRLDEGDIANGIDIFPQETRIAVFKIGTRALLKAAGVLVLGGSNYAQEILAGKGVSHGAQVRTNEDGYVGDIDGTPCHLLSNESLLHADGFLGLPAGTLKRSPFFGYVASSYANARGVSMVEQIKVVDSIDGQGVILQPFTKLGVATWYQKGVCILNKEGGTHGFFYAMKNILKKLGTTAAPYVVKAAGSRLFPRFVAFSATTSQITLDAQAKADGVGALGENHVKDGAWLVSDTEIKDFATFVKSYNVAAGGKKGYITQFTGTTSISGASASTSMYCSVAVMADDGSISFACKKING